MLGIRTMHSVSARSSFPQWEELFAALASWNLTGRGERVQASGISVAITLPFAWYVESCSPADGAEKTGGSTTDWADIQASRDGDEQAYARLVQQHQTMVATYMWHFTRNRADWEELVQDVFVEAYLSLPTYKRRAPFPHWLKRIATRVGYRYWRQRRPLTSVPDGPTECQISVEDATRSAVEAAELVHFLLGKLSPPSRLIMTLHYLEQQPVAEIARLTKWSPSRVKVTMFRARRHLKKICTQLEIEP